MIEDEVETAASSSVHPVEIVGRHRETDKNKQGAPPPTPSPALPRVSSGQYQHLAVAHAPIRDPRLLLLDEATSDVDTLTERIVQKALD